MTFWDYFQSIAIICIVIFAAYYFSRIIAKSGRNTAWKCSNLKLIGTLALGKDKEVAIVEIGKYAYILGVGGQRVERLDKVELAELGFSEDTAEPVTEKFSANFKNELYCRLKKIHK